MRKYAPDQVCLDADGDFVTILADFNELY